jgi:hypothetical protein
LKCEQDVLQGAFVRIRGTPESNASSIDCGATLHRDLSTQCERTPPCFTRFSDLRSKSRRAFARPNAVRVRSVATNQLLFSAPNT